MTNLNQIIKNQTKNLTKFIGEDSRSFRDEADKLRDAKQYADAAEAYERYLTFHPDDFGIWVQRGNCLKDSGSFGAAKRAYEAALKLNPDDADVYLQMGHLAKLQGHREEAIRCYRRSAKLDSTGVSALELERLGVRLKSTGASLLETPALKDTPVKILDIGDLLLFLDDNARVTGIQRVQCCIVKELLAEGADKAGAEVVIAYYDQTSRTVYALDSGRVSELIALVGSTDASISDVALYLEKLYASRNKISPRAIDTYLILGAYWIGDEYSNILLQMRRDRVSIGVYIYDLIPITHPQFVVDSTRQAVLEKFGDVIGLVDFVLTISEYVAKEVVSVLSSELNKQVPVFAVPLAHELPEISEEEEIDDEFVSTLPAEYVLCVCTLEGRKNHMLLLHVWTALNRKYEGRIPNLILVGKWGWRIEEFRSELAAARNVGGKIIVLGSVSDAHLKYLYEHCLFTVFPSFAEGWGLPVGESLAYGKPCIASNASSIPEVGGDFCRYINPYDPIGATTEIERAIVDRADLRAWTDRIAKEFKIRTWAEVSRDLMQRAGDAEKLARKAPARAAVVLDAGSICRLTREDVYGARNRSGRGRAVKFVCAAGWRPLEHWGAWSFRRNALIEFGTALRPKTKVQVFLNLRLPPPAAGDNIAIQDATQTLKSVFVPFREAVWVKVDTETDDQGAVKLQLERLGHVTHLQPERELYVGISAVAYYAKSDLAARIDLLEEMLLSREGASEQVVWTTAMEKLIEEAPASANVAREAPVDEAPPAADKARPKEGTDG
jgi:glycosyltransferase involved in cell wall biosynthesis